jgi:hypothetical protein
VQAVEFQNRALRRAEPRQWIAFYGPRKNALTVSIQQRRGAQVAADGDDAFGRCAAWVGKSVRGIHIKRLTVRLMRGQAITFVARISLVEAARNKISFSKFDKSLHCAFPSHPCYIILCAVRFTSDAESCDFQNAKVRLRTRRSRFNQRADED